MPTRLAFLGPAGTYGEQAACELAKLEQLSDVEQVACSGLRAVVEHLFTLYGDKPVIELLAAVGVDRDMVMAEVDAYALPVIDVLREEGYLEALIRRRLAPFYKSAAAKKLLQQES